MPLFFLMALFIPGMLIPALYLAFQPYASWKSGARGWFLWSGYIFPVIYSLLYILFIEPDYRYQYGKTYLSLIETGWAGFVTSVLLILIAILMGWSVLSRKTIPGRNVFAGQIFMILLMAYYTATATFLYNVSFMALLPGMYLVVHVAFLWNLFRHRSSFVKPVRLSFLSVSAAIISIAVWLKTILAHRYFLQLPEHQPTECFVVTAASKGHPFLVRSWHDPRRGKPLNRQLIGFYAFETWMKRTSPEFHSRFREQYNRIGPKIARQIDTRWKADVVFLLLLLPGLVCRCIILLHTFYRKLKSQFQ